jgi:hypothetical protein
LPAVSDKEILAFPYLLSLFFYRLSDYPNDSMILSRIHRSFIESIFRKALRCPDVSSAFGNRSLLREFFLPSA